MNHELNLTPTDILMLTEMGCCDTMPTMHDLPPWRDFHEKRTIADQALQLESRAQVIACLRAQLAQLDEQHAIDMQAISAIRWGAMKALPWRRVAVTLATCFAMGAAVGVQVASWWWR